MASIHENEDKCVDKGFSEVSVLVKENVDKEGKVNIESEVETDPVQETSSLWFARVKVFFLQVSVDISDTGTDLYTAYSHYENCNQNYGHFTLLFVMLQTIPKGTDFMKEKIAEIKSGELVLEPFRCRTRSILSGIIYLVLLLLLYLSGGIVCVTIYQIGQTLIYLLKLCKHPPGENGEIPHEFQRKAYLGKFVECQLESAPQGILQLVILLSHGLDTWVQILSVAISIFSLAKGTTDSLVMMKNGNQKAPPLRDSFLGVLAILPETILRAFSHSIVIVACIQESWEVKLTILVLYMILMLLFFLLSAVTSDSLQSFIFSFFSSIMSPLLFDKHFSKENNEQKISLKKDMMFYAANKLISSTILLAMLTLVLFTSPTQVLDTPEQVLRSSSEFDCPNRCPPTSSANATCISVCQDERNAIRKKMFGLGLFVRITKITDTCEYLCNNSIEPEKYRDIRSQSCSRNHETTFLEYIFPALITLGILSILDSLLMLSYSSLSPSIWLLFVEYKDTKHTETENMDNLETQTHASLEKITAEPLEKQRNPIHKRIFHFIFVFFVLLNPFIVDRYSGCLLMNNQFTLCNHWWSILSLACMILPSIPTAVKTLRNKISEIKSGKRISSPVKGFLYLISMTIGYFAGGFLLLTIVQWVQVIIAVGKYSVSYENMLGNELKMAAYLGLLRYDILDPSYYLQIYVSLKDIYLSTIQMLSITLSIMSSSFWISQGILVLRAEKNEQSNFKAKLSGALALLPEILLRSLAYPILLIFGGHLTHIVCAIQLVANFFTATILWDDFETVVYTVIASVKAPILFDPRSKNKEILTSYRAQSKTFYAINKITTSVTLLFLVTTLAALSTIPQSEALTKLRVKFPEEKEQNYNITDLGRDFCFNNCEHIAYTRHYANETEAEFISREELTADQNQGKIDLHAEICDNYSLISTHNFLMIVVPILISLCLYSLVDGVLLYKQNYLAPSYQLLFKENKTNAESPAIELEDTNCLEESSIHALEDQEDNQSQVI